MNNARSEEDLTGDCPTQRFSSECCNAADNEGGSCCSTTDESWSKRKALISGIIIAAAIAVGGYSLVKGNANQSESIRPTSSFSADLREAPTVRVELAGAAQSQERQRGVSFDQVIDSLRVLDTATRDKDAVFLLLHTPGQPTPRGMCARLEAALNKLPAMGARIGAFTLRGNSPDRGWLAQRLSIKSLPCVVVLGRSGTASVVSGDISDARLYEAFFSVTRGASCCPASSEKACCPK